MIRAILGAALAALLFTAAACNVVNQMAALT